MVRVAIVGAGGMANEHIRAFSALPDVEVCGIHSRTRSRAEELAQSHDIAIVADSISELKDKTAADLVVVAVPELAANKVAKDCFSHDWAVLLEKPAGYDLADAEDIAAAAKAHSKPVMVGFNRRFYSSVATVLADIDTRDEARYVRIQDQQSYEEARRYNHPEEVVERFMYANSIHVIDLIRAICRGRVVDVNPIKPWMGEQTEVVLVYITFDSGDCALYEGLWKGPGPWAAAVSTPARRWLMQPLEDAAFQNAGERTRQERLRDQIDVDFKPGFFRQAEAVVASVRGQESAAVSIDQSLETMRLINRMFGV